MRSALGEVAGWLRRGRTAVLTVGGFGLLSAAAWMIASPAGLAAAGVSLLLIDYLADPDNS